MKEKVMEILMDIRPDVDFDNETSLITKGILESFDIMSIVDELGDEFGITIRPKDLITENFDSAAAIVNLVATLLEE